MDKFTADIKNSPVLTKTPGNVEDLFCSYNSELLAILDAHASLKTSIITLKNDCEWFTDELLAAKKNLRALEHKKKLLTGLTVHAMSFDSAATDFEKAKVQDKCKIYTTKIRGIWGSGGSQDLELSPAQEH